MSRYDLSKDDLAQLVSGEPAYRAKQLYEGLYHQLAEPDELSNLPGALRTRLSKEPALDLALEQVAEQQADQGRTIKWAYALADGRSIETVLMYYPHHATVCVSSQAGCAMGCTFCATGQAGYERHLSTGEIVEQVVRGMQAARQIGRRLDHVVFMGMGEPFANYAAVLRACGVIVTDLGLGARHVTLSTVGLIPQIRKLAAEPLQLNLAVSLHAARDELRNEIVPINRRYPLADLLAACVEYREKTRRRVSFEWALIAGVNDTDRDASELAGLARIARAHVNLIPLNDTALGAQRGLSQPSSVSVRHFKQCLDDLGINATVRQTRGRSIDAACGQLAQTLMVTKGPRAAVLPRTQGLELSD